MIISTTIRAADPNFDTIQFNLSSIFDCTAVRGFASSSASQRPDMLKATLVFGFLAGVAAAASVLFIGGVWWLTPIAYSIAGISSALVTALIAAARPLSPERSQQIETEIERDLLIPSAKRRQSRSEIEAEYLLARDIARQNLRQSKACPPDTQRPHPDEPIAAKTPESDRDLAAAKGRTAIIETKAVNLYPNAAPDRRPKAPPLASR